MIIWLEDPRKYRYLREMTYYMRKRSGFKKGAKIRSANFYKLVGYELYSYVHYYKGVSSFIYRLFYLRTYDEGGPTPNTCYSGIHMPSEGKLVTDLLQENLGKTYSCLDCKRFTCNRKKCVNRKWSGRTRCSSFILVDEKMWQMFLRERLYEEQIEDSGEIIR